MISEGNLGSAKRAPELFSSLHRSSAPARHTSSPVRPEVNVLIPKWDRSGYATVQYRGHLTLLYNRLDAVLVGTASGCIYSGYRFMPCER